ncbi:MBL fold metallo-hydrolase [Sphingomonas alba]|uniref:MBL fold metallo-hydrolase n=1 Tax=Sphingomonas alba TaxID=2908208 RepID=A0ABT0RIU8_9SPHN|nr:MBL fold metallo-hydrolase [Sphingomonas alba]MCL6682507.1 MBL fold metallo-hydrolase [Sphingomonas alba]
MKSRMMLGLLASMLAAAPVSAAPPPPEVQSLGNGLSVLIGSSCNVLILPGDTGVLIVDDQRRSTFDETMAGIRSVSDLPVRYVVDTHWHLDHSGGNGSFTKAGAVIVAQRNVLVRRSAEQYMAPYKQHIPADPQESRPVIIFDDSLDLRLGAETVELRHVAIAHTDGDTLVHFRNANVVAMGDVFFNHIFPFIDRSSGGSIQGMIKGVETALAMTDEKSRIVPAHGPVATRAELSAYHDMLLDVARQVQTAKRKGRTLEQVVASHPAAAYREGMEGEEDRFVEAIYDSFGHADLHHRI